MRACKSNSAPFVSYAREIVRVGHKRHVAHFRQTEKPMQLAAAGRMLRTLALCPQLVRQPAARMMGSGGFYGPRQQQLEQKLAAAFDPVHLEVINTSHGGVEHESHFKVVVVSDAFEGKRLIARHQSVNKAVMEEDGSLGFRASTRRTLAAQLDLFYYFVGPTLCASRAAVLLLHVSPLLPIAHKRAGDARARHRLARNWRGKDAVRVGSQQRCASIAKVRGWRWQWHVAMSPLTHRRRAWAAAHEGAAHEIRV